MGAGRLSGRTLDPPGRHESSTTRSGPEPPGSSGHSHDSGTGLAKAGSSRGYQVARRDAAESPGLMHGEVGVLLVSWKLEPTPEKEDRLLDLVAANARNPSHELFNGSPGTMLAALHLYEQTGDDRWRDSGSRAPTRCWSSSAPTRSTAAASGSSTAAAG